MHRTSPRVSFWTVTLFVCATGSALAQTLEGPAMPPSPFRATEAAPSAAPGQYIDAAGGLFQANVNAQGMNIVGDAANEPSIAIDPTAPNRMAIGWRQFDSISSNFREAGVAWTNDGGRTWHASTIDNGVFRSDPVLDSRTDGGLVYYSLGGPNFLCQSFISTDAGQNWSAPIQAFGGDKAWMIIDRQAASPGEGFAYAAWSTAANPTPGFQFARSTDGGANWSGPFALSSPIIWGTLATASDGDLYITGTSGGQIRLIRSTNAKLLSTSTPSFTTMTAPNMPGNLGSFGGPNPGGLIGQVNIDIDTSGGPFDGRVYVCASVSSLSDTLDVYLARSDDGGNTWLPVVRVNADSPGTGAGDWQWFGTMSVAPNGRVDVIWNDTSESGVVNLSRTMYAFSTDGGATFSAATALTPQWDSFVGWPQQNKIGDYYHMRSDLVGASLAFSTTLNGEQDVYFARIGDWDCNGNGVGDETDLVMGGATDCNANSIPDSCDIAAGVSVDTNGNGVPDECEVCYADCDSSGTLDFFDFLCFQNEFNLGTAYADCDSSGSHDFFDFLCFQNAFSNGCP